MGASSKQEECSAQHPVILRPAHFAGRRTSVVAGSAEPAGNLQRSFVGSPRRSRGLRSLRMTRESGELHVRRRAAQQIPGFAVMFVAIAIAFWLVHGT